MKHIIFMILLISFESCSLAKSKNKFEGNWYACAKDGFYIELLAKNNTFTFSSNYGSITNYEFQILGDTLVYTDLPASKQKDSVMIQKAKVSFPQVDVMMLDYISSQEHWVFYRIKDAITSIDYDKKLTKATQKRAKTHNCIDKRTKQEKIADSLRQPMIYFQF
jgi:hypothetical protein